MSNCKTSFIRINIFKIKFINSKKLDKVSVTGRKKNIPLTSFMNIFTLKRRKMEP